MLDSVVDDNCYRIGFIATAAITFFSSWIYFTAQYGFLFGFGLGWVPSVILAFLLGVIWPVLAFLVACLVLFLLIANK